MSQNRLRAGLLSCCIPILILALAGSATADVLYSNLTEEGTYSSISSITIRGENYGPRIKLARATSFVPSETARFESVELGMSTNEDNDVVLVELRASDGGSPGTLIESLGIIEDFPPLGSDSFLEIATSTLQPFLTAGVEYFIVLEPGNADMSARWMHNVTGATGRWTRASDGPWEFDDFAEGAIRVNGTGCGAGNVNAANGLETNVLFINGVMGGVDRTVEATSEQIISLTVLRPVAGGNGKFAIHANEGDAIAGALTALPFDIGTTCYPFLLSDAASPVIVANNLGRTGQIGESQYFGTPSPDPERASTTIAYPNLPVGTILTFQGVVVDPGSVSSKGVSVTNAVTLQIVP